MCSQNSGPGRTVQSVLHIYDVNDDDMRIHSVTSLEYAQYVPMLRCNTRDDSSGLVLLIAFRPHVTAMATSF